MKRICRLLLAAGATVCLALPAMAQTTTVSATCVGGVIVSGSCTGTPVASGTIYWQPVEAGRAGTNGGQVLNAPLKATVTAGAFSLAMADALQSSPNIMYAVTVIDNATGNVLLGAGLSPSSPAYVNQGGAYGCVQPTGTTWSFDTYVPYSGNCTAGVGFGAGGGTTAAALTLNASGAGAAPGTAFNGASGVTASFNTFGAVGFSTYAGTGTPTDTCSATVNVGKIEANAAPAAYQCSNATGSYAWNALGGGGGSGTVQAGSQYSIAAYPNAGSNAVAGPITGLNTDANGDLLTPAAITKVSPMVDPRAQGACPADGTTDCGAALLAAINECQSAPQNSCKVLVPGGNWSAGVYLANGNSLPKISGVVLEVQGALLHNGTLVLPDDTTLECDGGAGLSNFAIGGKGCLIGLKTQTAGTMGTAITATGSQTFTPTFTTGAASNFVCNTTRDASNPECGAITIAGIQSCSATASRNTTTNIVTYTLSSCTDSSGDAEGARIPVGSLLKASGCSDTTFNTSNNGVPVMYQDWPNGIEQVQYSGAGTSATGCTVTGFDDNTFETEWITNISGSTFTAPFAHKHAASDVWGIVNAAFQEATFNQHTILGAFISGGPGAALYTDNIASVDLEGDSFNATAAMTSIPMESDGTWQGIFKGDGWVTNIDRSGCSPSCGLSSYPYGWRLSQDANRNNGASGSFIPIIQGTILGGVKFDTNGLANNAGEGPDFYFLGTTIEQTANAAVQFDPRYGLGGTPTVIMDHVVLQDDFLGNTQNYLGSTDGWTRPLARITPTSYGANSTGTLGKYIDTQNIVWEASGPAGTNPAALGASNPSTGIFIGGLNSGIRGNFEGANAGQAPALVPYASLAVNSLSSVVTACGAQCSTKYGPDGVSGSALEIQSTGAGAGSQATFGSVSQGTYAGDWVVAVAQVKAGTNMAGVIPNSGGGTNALFAVVTSGTDVFANCQNSGTKCVGGGMFFMANDPWQPGLMIATVQTGESTAHALTFYGYSPANGASSPNQGEDFYDWAWFYVPGPNNPAYDGHTTQQDVVRMAQEMTHGFIPSGASPGALYFNPALALDSGANTIVPAGAALPYVGFKAYAGTGTPSDACSATANNGALEANATPTTYQCSNATGSYAWNAVGGIALPLSAANGGTGANYSSGAGFLYYSAGSTSLVAAGGSPGTVQVSTSRNAQTSDCGAIVVLTAAVTYTLPNPQVAAPSGTGGCVISIANQTPTTGASIALAAGMTYNGGSSAPPLNGVNLVTITDNTQTATDYRGTAPPVAGSGVNITESSNQRTFTATGSGGGNVNAAAALNSNQAVNGLGTTNEGTGFTDTAGTITAGDVAAYTSSGTIGNCATTPCVNALGIFNSSTTWLASGEATVNLDGTYTVTAGEVVCNSSSGATGHPNGSADCASGQRIGYVKTAASSVTTATVDLVRN